MAGNNNPGWTRQSSQIRLENLWKLRLSERYTWKQESLWTRYKILLRESKKNKESTYNSDKHTLQFNCDLGWTSEHNHGNMQLIQKSGFQQSRLSGTILGQEPKSEFLGTMGLISDSACPS